jgi:tetratricopeptide (TPR) repeat protein
MLHIIIVGSTLSALSTEPALSDTEDANDDEPAAVTSMDAMSDSGKAPAAMLTTAAEYATAHGDFDKAISLCRRALNKDADDLAVHQAYAIALEEKWKSQPESKKDPTVYQKAVAEWLIVLRNEAGCEKGLTFHGLTIPVMGNFYQDEEHVITARAHLVSLTGISPKPWQTDAVYLKKVLSKNDVSGKVLKK